MNTINEWLGWGAKELKDVKESQILLAHCLKVSREHLIAWPEKNIDPNAAILFQELISKRKQHQPIAYLVGEKEFWSLPFKVSKHTLIPRPETEHLIEAILNKIPDGQFTVVDIGTGSGAIACSLASERPGWTIFATDASALALETARWNAINLNLNLNHIQFIQTHWMQALSENALDLVVSNPPYIRSNDPALIEGDLPYEPNNALVGGESGLEAYLEIIEQSKARLKKGGLIAFEHGFDQALDLRTLLKENGFIDIETIQDLAGSDRVTMGIKTICHHN